MGRRGDVTDGSAEIIFQSSAEDPCEQFGCGQECLLFDVVHPAVPLPITLLPILQGALTSGSGEVVVAHHNTCISFSESFYLVEVCR